MSRDRSLYIQDYSNSKEVSFYPYLEDRLDGLASLSSISYLFRYPAFFSRSARFDDMLSADSQRQSWTHRDLNIYPTYDT